MNIYDDWRATLTVPRAEATGILSRAIGRVLAARGERAWAARVVSLEGELGRASERLSWSFVGSPSDSWGVLSGAGGRGLEDTLRSLARDSDGEAQRLARHLARGLPLVRAHTELGQHEHLRVLEQEVLQLVASSELSAAWRRRLIDHLPSTLRPLPASLAELERAQPPVTLYVAMHGPDQAFKYARSPWIELHDIVVVSSLRGLGVGSAALAELCAYADHHGLPIQGRIEPGPGKPDEAATTLAHWYYKRGFRQGNLGPDAWRRFGLIRREPIHADSTE